MAEHGVDVGHEPGGPRRVLRAAAGRPAPVVRRGVGPLEQRRRPGRACGPSVPSSSHVALLASTARRRCSAPSASSPSSTRLGGAVGRRARPRARAPVSSNDFIESRIHGHPAPTLADVPGLSARSRWIVVTLVTPSAPGVMIHSTRARRLVGERRVVQHAPRHHEAPARLDLGDLAGHGVASVRAARSGPGAGGERALDRRAVEVAARELGIGDRLPDGLGRRPDEGLEDVSWCRHRVSSGASGQPGSRSRRSSVSVAVVAAAYLPIQRSAISWIGTGLR